MSDNAPDTRRAKFRVTSGSLTLTENEVDRLVVTNEEFEIEPGAIFRLVATRETGCFVTCTGGEALMSVIEGTPQKPVLEDAFLQTTQDEHTVPTPLLVDYVYILRLPPPVGPSIRHHIDENDVLGDGDDDFLFFDDIPIGDCGGGGAMD